ncbi:uncharacterized protein LOC127854928 [Dreissena polymorpha]|uniref:uncharacterized protein LOC127854928 n=1 Tax=Dreissena polymorpha TaxID=45954 RepID=UPI00226545DE|nr:uncharacterized protein LOC127854928 [Dreissena polymorpha]
MKFVLLAVIALVVPSCYESLFLLGHLFRHNQCLFGGHYFGIGQFENPSDHGQICDCSYYGHYTCRRKECPPANCGTALQTTSGSCVQCAPQCATTRCPDLKCPVSERFYPPSSCCHKCYDPKSDSSDSDSSHHDTSKTSRKVKIHVHSDSSDSNPSTRFIKTSKNVNVHIHKDKTSGTNDHHTSKSNSDRRRNPKRYRREGDSDDDDKETQSSN